MTFDKERAQLSQRMREARELLGEYQDEFHRHFQISHSTYVRWEKYGPPDKKWLRLYIKAVIRRLKLRAYNRKKKHRDGQKPTPRLFR